jgi:hypothetical protein
MAPRIWKENAELRRRRPDGLPIPPAHFLMKVAGSPRIVVYLQGGDLAEHGVGKIERC